MECENCSCEHDGSYGSGRFCKEKCSRSFSTKNKRKEINKNVSKKLKGRRVGGGKFPLDKCRLGGINAAKHRKELLEAQKKLPYKEIIKIRSQRWIKYNIIIPEQDGKCNKCNLSEWLSCPILLELHHKDGNKNNMARENLECLCPNCHSQTDNWKFKNKMSV